MIFLSAKLLNPSSEMLESDEEDDDYEAGDSDEDEEDEDEEGDVDEALAKTVANAIRDVQGESDSESEEEGSEEDEEDKEDEEEDEEDDEDDEEEEIDEMELEKQILSKNKRSGNQLPSAPEPKKQKAEAKSKATSGGVRSLSNGMTIEDLKIGHGEKAKAGKRVRHCIKACYILKVRLMRLLSIGVHEIYWEVRKRKGENYHFIQLLYQVIAKQCL